MDDAIVIERDEENYGAYVPDLPGCVAVGDSEEEVRTLVREAVELHLEIMREDGEHIPPRTSRVDYVRVPAAA